MLKVYYTLIQADCYAAVYPNDMRKVKPIPLDKPGDIKTLYASLAKVNKRSRFVELDTHLLIEPYQDKPLCLMDSQGNVRYGNKDYQITPRAFLDVATLLFVYLDAYK